MKLMDMLNNKWYKEITDNNFAKAPLGGILKYISVDNQVPVILTEAEGDWLLSSVKNVEGLNSFFFRLEYGDEANHSFNISLGGRTWEEAVGREFLILPGAVAIGFKFYTEADTDKTDAVSIVKTEDDWFYLTSFRCRHKRGTLEILYTYGESQRRVAYRAFRCDDIGGLKKLLSDLGWLK